MNINYKIQGLRAVAFLMVFLSHSSFIFNSMGTNVFKWLGAFGVEIFIVLSGYLSYSSNKFGEKLSLSYLRNKIKKFYPLHIITLIFSMPLSFAISIRYFGKLVINAFLLQSWIPNSSVYFSFNMVSWYLSTFIFLIVITPFSCRIIEKLSRNNVLCLMISFIIFEFVWSQLAMKIQIDSHWLIYVFPLVRVIDLMLGEALAKLILDYEQNRLYCSESVLVICNIAGWIIGIVHTLLSNIYNDNEIWSVAAWSIPTLLIIGSIVLSDKLKVIYSNKILVYLGNYGLELFLIHQLIIIYANGLCDKIGIARNVFIYVICLMISVWFGTLYKGVGRLLLSLKKDTHGNI